MNISMKQKQTHREQTCGCQGGGGWEREGLGAWDQQMKVSIHRMDKQQGPTVQHRELYSIFCDKPDGKEYVKEYIYICITESLCCTSEINTTL